jgi:hypothetical protein
MMMNKSPLIIVKNAKLPGSCMYRLRTGEGNEIFLNHISDFYEKLKNLKN